MLCLCPVRAALCPTIAVFAHCACQNSPVLPDGFFLWLFGPVLPDGFTEWVVLRVAQSPWFTWS